MFRVLMFALIGGLLVASGGLVGQDKKDQPKAAKKDEPAADKGRLPTYWGKIGLSDEQKQEVYKVQGKYNAEIDKLEAKLKELRATRDKEMRAVLTPSQKKALQELVIGKDD